MFKRFDEYNVWFGSLRTFYQNTSLGNLTNPYVECQINSNIISSSWQQGSETLPIRNAANQSVQQWLILQHQLQSQVAVYVGITSRPDWIEIKFHSRGWVCRSSHLKKNGIRDACRYFHPLSSILTYFHPIAHIMTIHTRCS